MSEYRVFRELLRYKHDRNQGQTADFTNSIQQEVLRSLQIEARSVRALLDLHHADHRDRNCGQLVALSANGRRHLHLQLQLHPHRCHHHILNGSRHAILAQTAHEIPRLQFLHWHFHRGKNHTVHIARLSAYMAIPSLVSLLPRYCASFRFKACNGASLVIQH